MSVEGLLSNDILIFSLIIIGVIFSGVFSSTETAIFTLGEYRLKQLIQVKGPIKAKNIHLILEHPNKITNTIVFGNALADVAASVLAAFYAYNNYGSRGLIPAIFIIVFFIFIFGETLPKTIARNNAASVLLFNMHMVKPIFYLFYPFTWFLYKALVWVLKLLGKEIKRSTITEDDLAFIIEEQGVVDEQKQEMLSNIFDISDILVREVMTPRTDMSVMSADISKQELKTLLKDTEYSRIPVYKDDLDNIVGILHIKDILTLDDGWTVPDLLKTAHSAQFIPETKKIDILLKEFQRERNQMALVVDEYGSISGLVTMEDILEEIVGEIRDEYDEDEVESEVVILKDGHYCIDAKMNIDDFCDYFFINKTGDMSEYDTVAGLVLDIAKAIPSENDRFIWKGFEVIIRSMKSNKIQQVDFVRIDPETVTGLSENTDKQVAVQPEAREDLYKQVYFHAVRRAMLENENILKQFMDKCAVDYDYEKLKTLDDILVDIFDNDLFDLIMDNKKADDFKDKYDVEILRDIVNTANKQES